MANSYTIIGLMSGTSCDGLDVAVSQFNKAEIGAWDYQLLFADTFEYPNHLKNELKDSINHTAAELFRLDKEFARFMADSVNKVKNKITIEIDAIASHGHTVHHRPDLGYTVQIGCGETLAFLTGLKVINNFRQKDVAAGGQGAPLVPIGDKLLFSKRADAFLNIGGISNITFIRNQVIAYDICPGNLPLNKLVAKLQLPYDDQGEIASSGELDIDLLEKLNTLQYYSDSAPKSLGIEWLESSFYPLIPNEANVQNALRTIVEHIALQIATALNSHDSKKVLITGGGAKNAFLIERIRYHYNGHVIVPEMQLIDFKEAVIFGFLGVLNLVGEPNCISSVTGATKDVIGGEIHLP